MDLETKSKLSSVLVKPDRGNEHDIEERRKALLESQRNDEQVLGRNKRMFGMLVGTLKQFKNEESGRERLTVKKFKIEEKLEHAAEEQRTSIRSGQESDRYLDTRRRHSDSADGMDEGEDKAVEEKVEQFDQTIIKLDTISRFKNWESDHKQLCNFIQTEAKPKIFWLPKEHTSFTERRLKETKDYFTLCVAERTAKFRKEMDELEKSTEDRL